MFTFEELVSNVTLTFDPFDNYDAFMLILNSPLGSTIDFR